ncbi:MAG: preprotein translocase subunit SecG [Azospirillaceae bacterium]
MQQILLAAHLVIAIGLVATVLLQRSEGGGLGIGGGGGFMSTRGQANLLTRATALLAAAFMGTSLMLAILAGANRQPSAIVEERPAAESSQPAPADEPSVPLD